PRPVTGGDERPKPGARQLSALWLCAANHQLILFYWQRGSREVLSFKHRAEAAALLPAEDGALLDWHGEPFKWAFRSRTRAWLRSFKATRRNSRVCDMYIL